ncbi:15-hydroxyprostaglandin dehydrogenase NAD+ [Hondaea fermentalgiana]|uniref:15-hydroxyprostaglandin dehydrogenase NAD n=1 Tax=Hondaea fermentalgiana TaxID=2315210 RepID=A0A2R5GIW4_9STRA|nr:15-hydroxyprostaglandin dehydrogenase NAD+ [Hondaea fermentalgiana]|eukprot:GBG28231.1 15-hydroxyprostaglandin dehydrogenase NAD+ [Hondaea fermentalgiana]
MKVQGQVCWVSGAAQGIGLELCKLLAADGGKVVLVDICDEAKGKRAAEAVKAEGGDAAFVRADMSDVAEVRRALEQAKVLFGDVATIVSHNAGIVVKDDSAEKVSKMIAINTQAIIVGTQIAADLMIQAGKKQGAIVNTSSMAGLTPVLNTPAYAGSKWAVVGYTISSAKLARQGIRVNCVCPNLVDTPDVGSFFEAEFKKGGKVMQKMAEEKLDARDVARAHLSAIYDDELVASAITVVYGKTSLYKPNTLEVVGHAFSKNSQDYFVETSKL